MVSGRGITCDQTPEEVGNGWSTSDTETALLHNIVFQSTRAQAVNSLGTIPSFVPRLLSSNSRFSEAASFRFSVTTSPV